MDLLWDKGFALCFKDRFNAAFFAGTNNLTINMRSDMPGSEASREYRQKEDLCTHTGDLNCKCAEGNLNFLGSEWGPPPSCYLNLKQVLFKPEVFAELDAGLPKAAQDVASAPARAPLSANLSYLLFLRRGDGLLNESAAQVRSFINQDKIKCVLGEQLAEDHLATLSMLLSSLPSHTQSDVYVSLLTFPVFILALKPKLKSIPDLNIIFSTHYKACNFKRNFFKEN